MNRAVEVLVECIPSPLGFSHPVHPIFSHERTPCWLVSLAVCVIYKPYAPLFGARPAKIEHWVFVQKTNNFRAAPMKKDSMV
jgi:hypothetical protein